MATATTKEAIRVMYYGEEKYIPLPSKKKFKREIEEMREEGHPMLKPAYKPDKYWD